MHLLFLPNGSLRIICELPERTERRKPRACCFLADAIGQQSIQWTEASQSRHGLNEGRSRTTARNHTNHSNSTTACVCVITSTHVSVWRNEGGVLSLKEKTWRVLCCIVSHANCVCLHTYILEARLACHSSLWKILCGATADQSWHVQSKTSRLSNRQTVVFCEQSIRPLESLWFYCEICIDQQ